MAGVSPKVREVGCNETYVPVLKLTLMAAVLALSASHDLELHQRNVLTAFLKGDLDEKNFMEVPQSGE